jgi:hypothetical protein
MAGAGRHEKLRVFVADARQGARCQVAAGGVESIEVVADEWPWLSSATDTVVFHHPGDG